MEQSPASHSNPVFRLNEIGVVPSHRGPESLGAKDREGSAPWTLRRLDAMAARPFIGISDIFRVGPAGRKVVPRAARKVSLMNPSVTYSALGASVGYEDSTASVAYRLSSTTVPSEPIPRGIVNVEREPFGSAERAVEIAKLDFQVAPERSQPVGTSSSPSARPPAGSP